MQHTRGTYRQYRDEVLTAITTLHVATIEEYAESFTGQGYTVAWNSDRHEAGFTARVTVFGREEVVSFVPVAPEEEGMDPWALLESSVERMNRILHPGPPEAQFAERIGESGKERAAAGCVQLARITELLPDQSTRPTSEVCFTFEEARERCECLSARSSKVYVHCPETWTVDADGNLLEKVRPPMPPDALAACQEALSALAQKSTADRIALAEAKGYADGIAAQRLLAEKSAKDTLESMIDSSSLSDVLSLLAEVCGDKASHLSENWQDANAAKVWERSAARIVTACNRVHEYGL